MQSIHYIIVLNYAVYTLHNSIEICSVYTSSLAILPVFSAYVAPKGRLE